MKDQQPPGWSRIANANAPSMNIGGGETPPPIPPHAASGETLPPIPPQRVAGETAPPISPHATSGEATSEIPAGWTLPKLRVDINGEWWDDDVQITHHGILANLRGNLRRDAEGYFIQTRVRIPVFVEDVPWIVVRAERRGEILHAFLSDGTEEPIDPATLRIGTNDVPYCTVKEGRFDARLSRAATFQLFALVERDAGAGEVVKLGSRTYPLRRPA